MKFSCDQCKTKYTIADERVRGKVLKIRCKQCSHVITVRDESGGVATAGAPVQAPAKAPRGEALERAMDQALKVPPAAPFQGSDSTLVGSPDMFFGKTEPPPTEAEEWHLSVDGVASGPYRLETLAQRVIVERAAGDQEIFVWRDGFDDWLPPGDVVEVRGAVERLRPGLPRNFWAAAPAPTPAPTERAAEPVAAGVADQGAGRPGDSGGFATIETPPTIAVPRRADLLTDRGAAATEEAAHRPLASPLPFQAPTAGAQPPASPFQAPTAGAQPPASPFHAPTAGAKPPAFTFGAAGGATTTPASGSDVLSDVLAGFNDPSPAPSQPSQPTSQPSQPSHPSPRPEPEPDLAFGEPSLIINLAALASSARPNFSSSAGIGVPPRGHSDALPVSGMSSPSLPGLSGLDGAHPAPPSGSGAVPVLVISGPAPVTQTGRSLKIGLSAAIAMCVLLLGTVAYLLTRPHPVTNNGQAGERRDDGKRVTDLPVIVQDDGARGDKGTTPDPDGKKNGGQIKKPRPVPPSGRPGSTVADLTKLYGDNSGGDVRPVVPVLRQRAGAEESGAISGTALQDVVRKNQKSISACYERVLKRDESLRRARIDVTVKVGMTGIVTHVTLGGAQGGTELGLCIQQTIRRWHFPPSDSDYETQFPIILQAS